MSGGEGARMAGKKSIALAALTGGVVLSLDPMTADARHFYDFPTPVTPIATETLHTHDLFLAIITVIFVLSLSVLLYSIYTHRKSRGYKPAAFTHPTTTRQWIFATIPFAALVFIDYVVLGIPAFHSILAVADTHNAQMVVKVTGSQWKWQYEYPGYGIKYVSSLSTPQDEITGGAAPDKHFLREVDHPLVLPINEKVEIVLASDDVIHSFWVPAFGIKQDAVPGSLRETWVNIEKPGVYRGQCAELCGVGHAFMPIVVVAKTEPEFKQWLAQQQAATAAEAAAGTKTYSEDELIANGKKVYETICSACHQATGLGVAGTFPPIAAGQPFTAAPGMIKDLSERGFYKDGKIAVGPVKQHIDIVRNGIPGTAMPAFKSQLSALDIAAVITYERNDFGNHTGEAVQPADVNDAAAGK